MFESNSTPWSNTNIIA
ncbi:unnamed protein product, partial [Rotaria magnacalcarata]